MAKFTFDDKLWAVKEYEKGSLSYRVMAELVNKMNVVCEGTRLGIPCLIASNSKKTFTN
ncbi:hypothetical protein J2Y03_003635 [Neobacillus niacini]|nr:hypothetical protein [Neobacillus niacini]